MNKAVSIIIPAYNEESTIIEILKKVDQQVIPNTSLEVIVVDDCSTDNTLSILRNHSDLYTTLCTHKKNQGKGAAIRTGFSQVKGDVVIIQDADLEYDPVEYPRMINPILHKGADVVYGSRFRGNDAQRVLYFWHRMGNGLLTFLSNMVTNLNLTDMETCYKAFRREVVQSLKLEENRFGIEPEITAKLARKNYRIYEVGISYHGRTYAQGKKIGWKDGFRALYCIIKYGLLGR